MENVGRTPLRSALGLRPADAEDSPKAVICLDLGWAWTAAFQGAREVWSRAGL